MELKSPAIKNAIYQLVCFVPNQLGPDLAPVPRSTYPAAWAKPALEVKALIEATMRKEGEYAIITSDPVFFSEKQLQAIAHFFSLHDDLPVTDIDTLSFFEELSPVKENAL
jgi:hypothetical protein